MTYWRLYYHLIFTTFERQPVLIGAREKVFYGVLYRKAQELGVIVHAAGSTADHVHVILSIPPKLSVAECVRHIKGASAFAINQMAGSDGSFKWQAGYGVLSISESVLETVIAYVKNQKVHHSEGRLMADYEEIGDEDSE